ncbi:MAG TPA: alpha/beta fold hydrolase [Steroidobacteraceae bacterium]
MTIAATATNLSGKSMDATTAFSAPHRLPRWLACLLALGLIAGCARLNAVKDQVSRVDSVGFIDGEVVADTAHGSPIIAAIFQRNSETAITLYRAAPATSRGKFEFVVPAGDYIVAAFIDRNRDSRHQPDEPGRFYGNPTTIAVAAKSKTNIAITIDEASSPALSGVTVDRNAAIGRNVGARATLDDARFAPENGMLGLWRPLDFLAGPEGGLFMLGDYDAARMPVIFVHGMGDTPRRFAPAIASLDAARLQPWVLYYPTGLRLDMISSYFADSVHQLQQKYGFTRFAIVAHSMGGLVTRSFVQKYAERFPGDLSALKLVVTINSPMSGMESASTGVQYSPIVIPSWQDVATGSPFLTDLDAHAWPPGVAYHLVFSYDGEKNGDGTVALASEIPLSLQTQATRLHGYAGTHVGTLSEPDFLSQLRNLLTAAAAEPAPKPVAWFDEWLGRWTGPEGTYLELTRRGAGYDVTIQSLDGVATYEGRAAGDRIEFHRAGRTESIRATNGADTGMKWLLDKARCLTVRKGEGYCRG